MCSAKYCLSETHTLYIAQLNSSPLAYNSTNKILCCRVTWKQFIHMFHMLLCELHNHHHWQHSSSLQQRQQCEVNSVIVSHASQCFTCYYVNCIKLPPPKQHVVTLPFLSVIISLHELMSTNNYSFFPRTLLDWNTLSAEVRLKYSLSASESADLVD